MKPRHQVSRAAIELIERFEGYRRKAAQLPDGRWTIGYGHTLSAREGAEVSESDAEALLIYDLIGVAKAVNDLTFVPLTQNQFDALCAFAFNIGVEAFTGSQVLKRLNEGALLQAASSMELWRRAEFQGETIVIDALVRRRSVEKTLFLTPEGAWPVAPTPVLRPELDPDAAPLVPREEPTALTATLDGDTAEVLRRPEPEPEPAPGELPEPPSSVTAAAESVAARLETLFRDEPPEPEAEPAPTEEPEAPPAEEAAPGPDPEPPFTLQPEPEPAPDPQGLAVDLDLPDELIEIGSGPDLFGQPEPANDPSELLEMTQAAPDEAEAEIQRDRVLIDDTAPFEFVPAQVQPLPRRAEGVFSLILLAILGLAFLAGGLFWATNAQPGGEPGVFSPRLVGALASVAGVGLFAITVYLLLQRLDRPNRRRDDK